jgi:hypothetical protein
MSRAKEGGAKGKICGFKTLRLIKKVVSKELLFFRGSGWEGLLFFKGLIFCFFWIKPKEIKYKEQLQFSFLVVVSVFAETP